jgi:hypothetical protein
MTLNDIKKTFEGDVDIEVVLYGRERSISLYVQDIDKLSTDLREAQIESAGISSGSLWVHIK